MLTETSQMTSAETDLVSKMYKGIRAWAVVLFLLGVASFVFKEIQDPVWGTVLIITAALSLKIRIPQIFAMYAVMMDLDAISHILTHLNGGGWWWSVIGAIQIALTVSIVYQLRKYRQLPLVELYQSGNWPDKLDPPQEETKILGHFTQASALMSLGSYFLSVLTCLGLLALPIQGSPEIAEEVLEQSVINNLVNYIFSGTISMAGLALALGTAALVPKNAKREGALVGVIMSAFVVTLMLAIYFIVLLFPA